MLEPFLNILLILAFIPFLTVISNVLIQVLITYLPFSPLPKRVTNLELRIKTLERKIQKLEVSNHE